MRRTSDRTGPRLVCLDRDGTINRYTPGRHLTEPGGVELLDGVPEATKLLAEHGYLLAVCTNQRAVAEKQLCWETLEAIHARISELIDRAGGSRISTWHVCIHRREAGCKCRKPAPGLLEDARQFHRADPRDCWMIGDQDTDCVAATRAGMRSIRIDASGDSGNPKSLLGAARMITRRE